MKRIHHLRSESYKPALFWLSFFALFWATCLLFAGGFTTSIRAGMAFLDWPLSNGSLNPCGWLSEEDQLAEHSHRLLGIKMGLISLCIFGWTYLREGRPWVRMLARLLVWVVVLQGVLGGARVRLDQLNLLTEHNHLAQVFAVLHACGAQVTLCLLVSITVALSRVWIERSDRPVNSVLHRWAWLSVGVLFIQLILGAVMRHSDAALAIPTFPLTPEGGVIPAAWSFPVAIHFAHRVGALGVFCVLSCFIFRSLRVYTLKRFEGWVSLGIACLLCVQILLGATVVWTAKNPYSATIHMLIGAFLLASVWMLTFLGLQPKLQKPVFKKRIPSISTVIHESAI